MADSNDLRAVYQQLSENYRAIDDFRTKLLGLLPFATAAGVGVLLNAGLRARDPISPVLLAAVGAFGFLATIGLFSYELHGIKKCAWVIKTGQALEHALGIPGAVATRPRQVAGFIDEPFAASVIYPATLSAWAFLALAADHKHAAAITAGIVFVVAFSVALAMIRIIEAELKKEPPISPVQPQPSRTPASPLLPDPHAGPDAP